MPACIPFPLLNGRSGVDWVPIAHTGWCHAINILFIELPLRTSAPRIGAIVNSDGWSAPSLRDLDFDTILGTRSVSGIKIVRRTNLCSTIFRLKINSTLSFCRSRNDSLPQTANQLEELASFCAVCRQVEIESIKSCLASLALPSSSVSMNLTRDWRCWYSNSAATSSTKSIKPAYPRSMKSHDKNC